MNPKKPEKPGELLIIQKTYDLILWYVPILNKLPRDHKFNLGDRIISSLYDLLDELITAKYSNQKLAQLAAINVRLERMRHQTKLLLDFKQMDGDRFQHAAKLINDIGVNVGRWIKQQSAPRV
ncbi:MAG: diversity-generating retroelement protein Avd [Acidobacteriota bacterium]|nr:diversity-generating retroelement protein Avd [Acidobacteriota bacterium]